MGATLTTASAIAKEVYEPKIVALTNDEAKGWKRIKSESARVEHEVGGKYVKFGVRVRRNHGIGYRQELGALPAAGQQAYTEVRVPLRYGYGRVQVTGQTMKLLSKNYQAFTDVMDREMTGLADDITKDTSRIFYGDGSGKLCAVTADGVNTVTVDDIRFLEEDQMIDIVSTAGTVRASNRKITAINESTKVVTYDGADASASVVATDLLVRTGNYGLEPQGLTSIIKDSGTLFSVDPTTTDGRKWKATRKHNSGTLRALSEGLMIDAVDGARAAGGNPSVGLCSLGVRRQYFALLSQQRRYTNTKEFAGGFTGLVFHHGTEIPIVDDIDAPLNKIFFPDEKALKIYQESEWSWEDTDGSVWQRVTGYDAFEAYMVKYWELGTERRNSHAVLEDITE